MGLFRCPRATLCFARLWAIFILFRAGLSHFGKKEGPVFIYEPPSRVEFSNNSGVVISCSAHGNPAPTIEWKLSNGDDIPNVLGLRHILPNGTLYFPPFPAEHYRQDIHSSSYRCMASNIVGTIITGVVRVMAVVRQYYEVKVYDEFVILGNTAVIHCHIPSFVKDYVTVYSWVKDSASVISADIENGGRYSVFPTGELHIRNVGHTDLYTNYRCRTRHRLTGETRISDSQGRLVVTDSHNSIPPRVTDSRSLIEAKEGEVVELPCAAQGFPIPEYRWYKHDGSSLRPMPTDQRIQQRSGSLFIHRVTAQDAGNYVCIISNSLNEERTEKILVVTAPLFARILPPKQTVDVGKSATFNCSVLGYPVQNVTWLKDGRPLRMDNGRIRLMSNTILHLSSVRREDGGMYQCIAANSDTWAQGTSELQLGDVSPTLLSTFKEQTLQPGPGVSLKCIATGSPKPQISWTLDGLPIARSVGKRLGDYVSFEGEVVSHVNISSVRVQDGGEYECSASNGAGTARHAARLNVFGLPYVRRMANISVVSMESLISRCRVTGYPIESIHWEKEGRRLPYNHRQKVSPNGTLEIVNVDPTVDEGLYTCVARNSQGQSAQGKLYAAVKVPPLIERFNFDNNLHEGMRTRVYCNIARGDPPVTVTWLKDGRPIPADLGVQVQEFDTYSVTLVIERLSPRHNGNYTCVASNDASSVNFTAELVVNVPPHWVTEPTNTFVVKGNSVSLDCRAEGYPVPQVTWKQAPGKAATDFRQILSGPHYQVFENGTLRITEATVEDAGYYLCQASNGVGTGLSTVIFLTIHVPAYFQETHVNMTVRKGAEAKLRCEAHGDRPMAIIWNRDGQPINLKAEERYILKEKIISDGMEAEVTISSTQRSDSALFTCLVTNAFGHDQATLHLVVQEPPEKPDHVEITSRTSRTASISWSQPYAGNSPILSYLVQYKNASSSWQHEFLNVTVAGDQTRSTIRRLHPAFKYHLRVLARNAVGSSAPSDAAEVVTAEEVPGGPPTYVRADSLSSRSIRVTWKPPSVEQQHGIIKGYYIGYKLHDSTDPYLYKTMEAGKDFRPECILDNLKTFSKYGVLIQAYNSMGAGPRSDEVVATTLEDVPSEAPQSVHCSPLTSQTLQVVWSVPPASSLNGILQGYKVLYSPVRKDAGGKEDRESTVQKLKLNIHGLEKFTNYSIRVLAFTRAGDGVANQPIFCRTLEDVPQEPEDIKAAVMASDAVLVSWKPPLYRNGIVKKYTLYLRSSVHGIQNKTKFSVPSDQLYYELRSLTRGQRYEFWVTASTVVGEGDPSAVVTQIPNIRAPARIAAFNSRIVTNWRRDVELPCRTVGLPTPTREWRINGYPVSDDDRIALLPTGILRVEDVQRSDAGNYSCHVHNIYGSDEVHYTVAVEVPPAPPAPVVESTSASSISISWRERKSPDNPITGYEIHYKKQTEEWEHQKSTSTNTSFTITGLQCGSRYQIYVVGINSVGRGDPSDIVTGRTSGGGPVSPRNEAFIIPNATAITLVLDSWDDGGCPISHMTVEYKARMTTEWTLVTNHVKRDEGPMTLHDLRPDTWYSIRVTAHNSARSTVAEYDVLTLSYIGATIVPELIVHTEPPAFYEDTAVLVPIISSVIVLAAVVITLLIICHRKKVSDMKYAGHPVRNDLTADTALVALDKKLNSEQGNRPLPAVFQSPVRKVAPSVDVIGKSLSEDISPYATFHSPFGDNRLWQSLDREEEVQSQRRDNKDTSSLYSVVQKHIANSKRDDSQILGPRYASTEEIQAAIQKRKGAGGGGGGNLEEEEKVERSELMHSARSTLQMNAITTTVQDHWIIK